MLVYCHHAFVNNSCFVVWAFYRYVTVASDRNHALSIYASLQLHYRCVVSGDTIVKKLMLSSVECIFLTLLTTRTIFMQVMSPCGGLYTRKQDYLA